MIAAGLTKSNRGLCIFDVPLTLGKGRVDFVKHERMVL